MVSFHRRVNNCCFFAKIYLVNEICVKTITSVNKYNIYLYSKCSIYNFLYDVTFLYTSDCFIFCFNLSVPTFKFWNYRCSWKINKHNLLMTNKLVSFNMLNNSHQIFKTILRTKINLTKPIKVKNVNGLITNIFYFHSHTYRIR